CQIFKGNKGRRNASQRFMEIALSLPAVQDILLYSESPQVSWHAEDKLFYEKWKENYLKILQQGSRITLIHSLDRETRSLLNILLEWLPMELTGNMHSYYFSKYTDSPFKFTVMVIREKAALFSVTVPDSGKDIYTYLFADPVTVREGELLYSSLLANCNLIYRHYRETERDALLHMLTDSQQTPGNSYWFTTAPMFCILPEASLYEILSFDNLCSPSVPQYFRQYKKMQQLFIRSLQNHKCRVILSLSLFEEAYRPDFLRQQSAALTRLYRSSFRQSILHLLHLLTAYPNFEIALINNLPVAEPPEICLYTKENTLVMANSQLPDKTEPFTILSREQNVVNAYFVHFETYWHSIPPINRDREWVGEKFRNLLHNLAIDI
ncbi:MAG TPA: hypothetical protein GX699_05945, partial [Firmicutes bacterium]|nr:hypothetical protein [Bacillota bacterium]